MSAPELRRLVDEWTTATQALAALFAPGGRLSITAAKTVEFVAPEGLAPVIDQIARHDRTMYLGITPVRTPLSWANSWLRLRPDTSAGAT